MKSYSPPGFSSMSLIRATGMKLPVRLASADIPTDGTRIRGLPIPPLLPWPKPKPRPGLPIVPIIAASAIIIQ